MKAATFCFLAALVLVTGAEAQSIPANPLAPKVDGQNSGRRNLGGVGDIGGAVGAKPDPAPKTVVINYVTVTPLKEWTNLEGRKIQARVLAFSAPAEGQTGPVEVIREGKVRFLIPGKPQPVDYPLDQLVEEQRTELENIAKAAAGGPPAASEEEGEAEKAAESE